MLDKIRREYALFVSIFTLVLFEIFQHSLSKSLFGNIFGLLAIFSVVIYSAINVAHHAELLAKKFGEPYGTLILTMSAVTVEVMIISIMMLHAHNPYLARDTIYSAIMLDINGLLGISAIIGGLKFGEQKYNIDSSNSYISMLLVAIGISMVLPHFIDAKFMDSFMWFIVVIFILLYFVFTKIQLKDHKYFFEYKNTNIHSVEHLVEDIDIKYHITLLVIYIIIIGFLSEILALFMENTLQSLGLPLALGALAVALISASPELIVAIRASLDNRMQTVVNIAFGASLATVLLTVPSVILVSNFSSLHIDLALTDIQELLLGLTFFIGVVNFNDGETNVLEGFLHFIIFIVFAFMLFV
jgi:Ca2+:H+ antiporter